MSWEGHEEMGRGAIFANYDDARAGGKLNDVSGDYCLPLCLEYTKTVWNFVKAISFVPIISNRVVYGIRGATFCVTDRPTG